MTEGKQSEGRFTDDDVARCTGLSVRAWRELIKVGAVRTIGEDRGPGRVRICDSKTFKRTAIIAALKGSGLSLAMAGRVAYLLPLDQLFYAIWDPCSIMLDLLKADDPDTGLPPRLAVPKADWFNPDKPAQADPDDDWLIEIYDSRFVGVVYGSDKEPLIYGEVRNEGTTFVTWFPFHRQLERLERRSRKIVSVHYAKWQHPFDPSDEIDLRFLDYKYESHDADDPLCMAAETATRSPLTKTTINATLAIRRALRRYLGLGLAPAG